ncbi:MAG TPA: hypothetical protein VEA16_22690 [Vicinamibacterales bacterium]|nr:hypothetical protein [Vicinamibacterales bacterium]
MSLTDGLQFLFWLAVSLAIGTWIVFAYWRLRSAQLRRAKGETPLRSSRDVLWRHPGPLTAADVEAGPCAAPAPPFHFVEEHDTGSQPCLSVRDASGHTWRVKWGAEVHTEVFGTRLAWALGYFAEPSFFVAEGRILNARDLSRARDCVAGDGTFKDARFELSERGVTKHFDEHGWAWHDNPFAGTKELHGLKILMMLVSNWDNKDVRDVARGSNTAIFEHSANGGLEARYLIIDWGAALGAWGSNILQRGRWDPAAFAAQNEQFILGVEDGGVLWGYQGQRTLDLVANISVDDVRWFDTIARAITDDHLRAALRASGANGEEVEAFTAALRGRFDRIREVATAPARQTGN